MKMCYSLIALFLMICCLSLCSSQTWQSQSTTRFPSQRATRQSLPTSSQSTTTPSPGVVYQIPGCNCPSTFEFNPVCGTDNVTYGNAQKLKCAQACGKRVKLAKAGTCTRN